MPHKTPLVGLVAALLVALAIPSAAHAAKTPKRQYYVSLGDSYAVGWQHPGLYDFGPTKSGFDRQIPKLAKKKHYRLKEVNFGCGGATTTSILESKGCPKPARAIGGRAYKTTQAVAAERFLRSHRGKVALVTVSIGGNDVTACGRAADPVTCVATATANINKNVTKLAKALRKAGGKKMRIVGTTYPDVILGQWVRQPVNQSLAKLSVIAFQQFINPALVKAYKAAKGKLVDVTKATGAYTPLEQTTSFAPYGTIPVAVAKVCQLTWYCQFGDIHANRKGYKIIAQLVVKTLPKRKL
jgi:lysophospholipase L1-like esterase